MDDELDYRTPAILRPATTQVSSTDEQNFNTLEQVRDQLREGIAKLYKDFNAFAILKTKPSIEARDSLLRQIAGKQEAYDILVPILATVEDTIDNINGKWRQE